MRLSDKGCTHLNEWMMHKLPIDAFEFKPEDFMGAVVLTVDEAKAVNEAIEWLCSTLEDYEREHDNTPALIEGWNQMDFLEHRIEQAEKGNETK